VELPVADAFALMAAGSEPGAAGVAWHATTSIAIAATAESFVIL
jgi:hypothetical protein